MFTAGQFARSVKNLFRAAAAKVLLKVPIRIEEITDDQIEAVKVISQVRRQLRSATEEPRESAVFNRADRVGVEALLRERDDVRVAENLELRLWELRPQRADRGQR